MPLLKLALSQSALEGCVINCDVLIVCDCSPPNLRGFDLGRAEGFAMEPVVKTIKEPLTLHLTDPWLDTLKCAESFFSET